MANNSVYEYLKHANLQMQGHCTYPSCARLIPSIASL